MCKTATHSNTSLSSRVFDELFVTLESLGVEKTIQSLKDARVSHTINDDFRCAIILKAVSEITEVSIDRIAHGTDRNDNRKIAVALAVFIMREYGYSYPEIRQVIPKDESALHRYKCMVKIVAKPKSEFDKKLNEYYKKIQPLVKREKK